MLSLSKAKILKFVFHLSLRLELLCWPHLSSIAFLSDCCFLCDLTPSPGENRISERCHSHQVQLSFLIEMCLAQIIMIKPV